jgi:predicted AAA+ superfamily ATPase
LESVHLVYRLPSFGYGKEVLRARYKLYLSDAAIAPSILMKAKTILEDSKALGTCVETAIMAHLMNHSQMYQIRLSYWRNSKEKEVDFVLEREGEILPFEVKYQSQSPQSRDVLGLLDLCNQKSSVKVGYVITKNPQDSGPLECNTPGCAKSIMRIPAALFCYWLGESVLLERNIL